MKGKCSLGVIPVMIIIVSVLTVGFGLVSGCVAPSAEKETIKYGMALPLTGWFASDAADARDAATLAVEEINAEGGLLGRQIEIIVEDQKNFLVEDTIAAAERLAAAGVDFIDGGYHLDPVHVSIFGKYDIPYFHVSTSLAHAQAFMEDPEDYWNVFQVSISKEDNEPGHAFWCLEQLPYEFPNKKAAILTADWAMVIYQAEGWKDTLTQAGWEVPVYEQYTSGTTEFGPLLVKIRAENPSLIVFASSNIAESVPFMRQFLLDPTDSLVWQDYAPALPEFTENLGEEANGMLYSVGGYVLDTPESKAWVQKFVDRFGRRPNVPYGADIYGHVYWWAEAVKAVGDPSDSRAIAKYFLENPGETLLGRTVIDPITQTAIFGDDTITIPFLQIQDGQEVLLFKGENVFAAPEKFQVPSWIEME